MSLRITRAANTRIFLGTNLDQRDMEATATDTVWIRKVENLERQSALINVRNHEGVVEATLGIEESLGIREGVSVKLKGISETWATAMPYCESCGRGEKTSKQRLVAQAKVEVSAPKDVQIFRDDMVKGKKNA